MDELLSQQKINGENLNTIISTWNKTAVAKRTRSYVVGMMDEIKEKWKAYGLNHQEL